MADDDRCRDHASAFSACEERRSQFESRTAAGGWTLEDSTRELDIFPSGALPARISEERGRVVRDDERNTVIPMNLAAQLADRGLRVKQCLRRDRSECENHFRLKQLDLTNEIWTARRNLLRQRIAVAWRAVFQNVADVDLFARQIDGRKNFCEQLSSRADKWPSCLVFRGARRFTDAHQLRVRVAFA